MQEIMDSIMQRDRARKIEREAAAANNRARMRAWSPEFYSVIEQLEARGMFGRVVEFKTEAI